MILRLVFSIREDSSYGCPADKPIHNYFNTDLTQNQREIYEREENLSVFVVNGLAGKQKNQPIQAGCGGASRTRTYGLAALGQVTSPPRFIRHWQREATTPHRCERCAGNKKNQPVQAGCGGASRTRTYDPIDVNDVLYRLSHGTMSLDDMGYDTTLPRACQPLK